jgi:hypothetical protein
MNWKTIEGNRARYKHYVHAQWSRIATVRHGQIAGRRDDLARELQAANGLSKCAAEWQLPVRQGRRDTPVVVAECS